MKNKLFRLVALFLMLPLIYPSAFAQSSPETAQVQASKGILLGKSVPLKDLPVRPALIGNEKKDVYKQNWPKEVPNFRGNQPMPRVIENPLPLDGDPIRQIIKADNTENVDIEPLINLDAIDENDAGGIAPPDPVGAVNENYFVQMVNAGGGTLMAVTDKDGNFIQEAGSIQSLWTQFNASSLGDPMVVWDQEAGRWFILELSSDFASMLIGISETDDPLGSYFVYQVTAPGLPDYPKISMWSDAYYITTNEFTDNAIPVYALDREAMLNGEPNIDFQRILAMPKFATTIPGTFQVASPVNWDGVMPPPAGSPQYAIRIHDDAWGEGADRIEVWEVTPDFDSPGNTVVNGPLNLPTAPFDSDLCNGNIFDCLLQGNGNTVSALQQVIMYRSQYRNFGSHEAIVLNFSVDVTGNNTAGIRWMELRKEPGGDWFIYQESTFSPDDDHRWMASIAMDGAGNIGMTYSHMSDTEFPTLRFTGRRNNDPLGEMTVNEVEPAEGLSWNPGFRWGDYAALSVDPTDERTFWATGEYMKDGFWGTRIVSFVLRRDTIDVGPLALLTPQSADDLTDSEVVTARFTNFGLEAQSNFEVGFLVDETFIEKTLITNVLQPDSSIEVTFSTPVDMSEIRPYEFKVFTDLTDDANVLNDTLRATVRKLPRLDATLTNVNGLINAICGDFVDLQIEITNLGTLPLTSATVTYTLNGGAPQTIDWTGNLLTGESEFIDITLTPLIDGENSFSASTSFPNGMADENPDNDDIGRTFDAFIQNPQTISLELLLDDFPNETTWRLDDEEGNVLFSGGPYTIQGELIVDEFCIAEGCYTFTIFDSAGDGICCGFGQGNYRVVDNTGGFILAQGGAFGFQESTEFCLPFVCNLEFSADVVNENAPGANNGIIFFDIDNGTGPFMFSIDGGENFETSPFFNGLPGGIYTVVVMDAQGCTAEQEVLVGTCAVDFTAEVMGVSEAGSSDGSIIITATSAFPPLKYSIDGGDNQQDSPIFENLPEGDYEIEVIDSIGCSSSQTVNLSVVTSLEELYVGTSVLLSPNPTNGKFRIELRGLADALILDTEIIDQTGKVIQRGKLSRYNDVMFGEMSLYAYPTGIYYLRFIHPDLKKMVRVVKN